MKIHKKYLIASPVFFLIALLIGMIFFSIQKGSSKKNNDNSVKKYAAEFREAVEKNDEIKAIQFAELITVDVPFAEKNQRIENLFLKNGVDEKFQNKVFNHWDFKYWRDAFLFHRISQKAVADIDSSNSDKVVKKIFEIVSSRLEAKKTPDGYILWPVKIWELQKGLCDRQAWVACELLYQLGFETMIVYLIDPKTKVSPHTICEIRKGEKVWVLDPFFEKMMSGISVLELAQDEAKKKYLWQKRPDLYNTVKSALYWLPAYPQDYCPRNQILIQQLGEADLSNKFPRFGEDPQTRLKNYLLLVKNPDVKSKFDFWFYPIRLLAADMGKDLPKK